jgi:hypothetical protein
MAGALCLATCSGRGSPFHSLGPEMLTRSLSLSKLQLLSAVLYAVAFPLSSTVGGAIQTFFLLATAPFLAIGYLTGGAAWALFGTPKGYPFGLFAGVFIQVVLILALWNKRKRKCDEKTT